MNDFSVDAPAPKRGAGALFKTKFLGIPVIYLAIVFVAALALYAWKAKPVSDGADEGGGGSAAAAEEDVPADLYPIAPTGTVYAGQPQSQVVENTPYFGNSEWLRKAVTGMTEHSNKSPGEIQLALQAYLNGDHLSYEQALIRDEAIRAYGMPPDSFTAGTADGKPVPKPEPVVVPVQAPAPAPVNPVVAATAPAPAPTPATQRRTHRVVKGDTLWELAERYYGNPTRWREISRANGNPNPRRLKIGRILVIP